MRATGKDGFLYSVKFQDVIVGGSDVTVEKSGFHKIKSKASTGSGIPEKSSSVTDPNAISLGVGMVYWAKAGQALAEGDSLIPMELKRISFVTDTSDSSSSSSHDVTTQEDIDTGTRSYTPGAFKERTGSINGIVDTNSAEQKELLKEYRMLSEDDGESVTVYQSSSSVHHYMLSRAEKVPEGEPEMWEYFPVITEQLQMDKPMDGAQPFNFNYRVDGSNKPMLMYIVKDVE